MSLLDSFRLWFSPPRHLILLILAAWLGLMLAEKRSERHELAKEALNNLIFYSIITFVVGGRLLFALTHLSTFLKSPLSLFSPNPDLFDMLAAWVAAILAGWIYGWRNKMQLWGTLDALVPFLAALGVGLGLVHLAAGTAFGKPTSIPWAISLWNAQRHPSQVYESLAALAILLFTWFLNGRFRPGILFLLFVSLSAAARLFLEAYRGDSLLVAGGFRQAQLEAWIVLLICFVLFELVLAKPDMKKKAELVQTHN